MIPRAGLRMQLSGALTTLTYYGRGPEENYRDRRTSQFIDEYTTDIKDMYEPYVGPQENNHRTDIYWCTLTHKYKDGLLFIDFRMMGMGGDNSWGAIVHEPCLIRPDRENAIEYGLRLFHLIRKPISRS